MHTDHQKEFTYGIHPVLEALKSDQEIEKIFIQKGVRTDTTKEISQLAKERNVPIAVVPVEKLNRLSKGNHQGAVAQISPVAFYDIDDLVTSVLESDKKPLFLLLDQLSDVRNFGAIIRTAECTGVHGIIIPKKGGAPVNGVAIKTSAGAAFNIPIAKVDHIKDAIYYLQGSGIQVIASTEKTDQTVYDLDFNQPIAVVMGREDSGVSSGVLKIVDQQAKLPLQGSIASLNVSVACGAFLYEIVRQRL